MFEINYFYYQSYWPIVWLSLNTTGTKQSAILISSRKKNSLSSTKSIDKEFWRFSSKDMCYLDSIHCVHHLAHPNWSTHFFLPYNEMFYSLASQINCQMGVNLYVYSPLLDCIIHYSSFIIIMWWYMSWKVLINVPNRLTSTPETCTGDEISIYNCQYKLIENMCRI